MRAWVLSLTLLPIITGSAAAQNAGKPAPAVKALKGRAIAGFTLKKTTASASRISELWQRTADGAQLSIEIIPHADEALATSRLNAVNAKIPREGHQSEELMFRYQTTADTKSWTNYRATHHITFNTYRFWKLSSGRLVMANVSFTRGKPDFDAARGAFIAAKKAADGTMQALAGGGQEVRPAAAAGGAGRGG